MSPILKHSDVGDLKDLVQYARYHYMLRVWSIMFKESDHITITRRPPFFARKLTLPFMKTTKMKELLASREMTKRFTCLRCKRHWGTKIMPETMTQGESYDNVVITTKAGILEKPSRGTHASLTLLRVHALSETCKLGTLDPSN